MCYITVVCMGGGLEPRHADYDPPFNQLSYPPFTRFMFTTVFTPKVGWAYNWIYSLLQRLFCKNSTDVLMALGFRSSNYRVIIFHTTMAIKSKFNQNRYNTAREYKISSELKQNSKFIKKQKRIVLAITYFASRDR